MTTAEPPATDPAALDYRAAAAYLGYSVRTVERLVASGELPKTGLPSAPRICREDLLDWLRRRRLPTGSEQEAERAPSRRSDPVGLRPDPERVRAVWGDR